MSSGDIVTCQIPGWAEFLPIYIACLKLGAPINPVPPNLRQHELRLVLGRCRSRALFIPRGYRKFTYCGMAAELKKDAPQLKAIVAVDKFREGSELPTLDQILAVTCSEAEHRLDTLASVNSDSLAAVVFTSGSEGESKGVMLSHRNILAAESAFSKFLGLRSSDIMFMPAPIAHAIGFHHGVSMPFINGMTTILQDKFVASEAIRLINDNLATLTMATTPFLHDLVNELIPGRQRLPSLRFFLCGGTPPSYSNIQKANAFGITVLNVYGSTESVPHMGTPPQANAEQLRKQALFPMPGIRVRIVDQNGQDVREGESGEEISAGEAVFMGYIDNPEATAKTLRSGWCYSGDLCRREKDGSYTITGRLKDIIVRGGENISCLEVENLLLEYENIREAAVVGMPDPRLQERICCFITRKNPELDLDLEDLCRHFAKLGVAKIKYPEHLELLSEMPKTHSGKINKAVLRKIIEAKAIQADNTAEPARQARVQAG